MPPKNTILTLLNIKNFFISKLELWVIKKFGISHQESSKDYGRLLNVGKDGLRECIGDKEEIYRYLILDHPIDVVPQKGGTDSQNELQKNVKTIQIVKVEDTYADSFVDPNKRKHSNWSNELIGKHIRVIGSLYSRVVRVVMVANYFEEVKKDHEN